MPTAKIVSERTFFPHAPFLDSASHFCSLMKRSQHVTWHDLLAATTLTAFSVEALANTAGELLVPKFSDFESGSPRAKIRLICKFADIRYDERDSPFAEVLQLLKARNQIAHPKFKKLRYESPEMPLAAAQEEYAKLSPPLHDLEHALNPELAFKWFSAVRHLESLLMGSVEAEKRLQSSTHRLVIKEEPPEQLDK